MKKAEKKKQDWKQNGVVEETNQYYSILHSLLIHASFFYGIRNLRCNPKKECVCAAKVWFYKCLCDVTHLIPSPRRDVP
ncbi:hypothetical protein NECAME_16014 [Necator americanus]|uniref:Uncharacterized protein n=1 Tax=Necator americanus TaxID=51031 RepID=W2U0Y6_NECAM|nr:hypothetical protein NECAME_16014 [Necator americanus]ETN86977.1 hypothetical protein NECAME_16014 [Necator americanus]